MFCRFVGLSSLALVLFVCARPLTADETPAELLSKAQQAANKGESKDAVRLLTQAISQDSELATAYYYRGREHFRLGKIRESVDDFDKYVELSPKAEAPLWERGISYYYDGKYKQGAKQFEDYQTYDNADVENSVWRYLCMARSQGVKQAREAMLPIENDTRVPMMQIYDLYRGKVSPADVLNAAKAGEPDERSLHHRFFYAHLYIGLYHEADGKDVEAMKNIGLAAEKYRIGHYMGDVAHVHHQILLRKQDSNK